MAGEDVERIEYLRTRVAEQTTNPFRTTFAIKYRGATLDLPKIRVEVSFPRYRLANGRTRRRQEQYLVDHPDMPADLFSDPASERAQKAQHEILYEMCQDANLEDLLSMEGQREPLVLTYDGYVVNGNRRLAILRHIPVTHAEAVVLPADADPKDISALEMYLQMSQDGKADYNWLDALLTIESNIRDIGFTEEEVAKEMGVYVKTIQLHRHELDLVNRYLAERGFAGEHFRVDGHKQAFETLAREHRNTTDPDRQRNLRQLGFNIIANPVPGQSVHRQLEAMIRNLDKVVDILVAEEQGETKTSSSHDDRPSDLLWLLDDSDEDSKVVSLPINEQSAKLVHGAVDTAKELSHERERARDAAEKVRHAARYLTSVRIDGESIDLAIITGQLAGIEQQCVRIRSEIQAIAPDLV
ncbi:MAG: hypothetical protein AB2L09_11900 [Coriobacteriia bacterium]